MNSTLGRSLVLRCLVLFAGASVFATFAFADGAEVSGLSGEVKSGPESAAAKIPSYVTGAPLRRSFALGAPFVFSPEPPQSSNKPHAAPVGTPEPVKPGWARRHVLLLSGLALTGGGAAMVSTGGPGDLTGCLHSGINGQLQCSTVSTWGGSGRHISGILLLSAGVPITIWGLFRHQ